MDRNAIAGLLTANPDRFYVYQLTKPDGTPFYIGKGYRQRIFHHEVQADGPSVSHKLNTIRQIKRRGQQIDYSIVDFYDCESECHAREMQEILRIGRHDLRTGPLTNLTAGGEGTVGLSDETLARIDFELHSANAPGDRGVANRFFLELAASVRSVPVRPLRTIQKPRPLSPIPFDGRKSTTRQAAALAASAIANRRMISTGATLPRRMEVDGVPMVIEYGACKDILRSGLATYVAGSTPEEETLALTELGYQAIVRLDKATLVSAGVLMPE